MMSLNSLHNNYWGVRAPVDLKIIGGQQKNRIHVEIFIDWLANENPP